MTDPQHCAICGRLLDNPSDPKSVDRNGVCSACRFPRFRGHAGPGLSTDQILDQTRGEDDEQGDQADEVDLYPNKDSEDYKLVKKASETAKLVKLTGMSRAEKLANLEGKVVDTSGMTAPELKRALVGGKVEADKQWDHLAKAAHRAEQGHIVEISDLSDAEYLEWLKGAKAAADRGETIDVTHWTPEQIVERFLSDGVDAALAMLDGTPEEDDEVHRAALRALDDDERDNE
jgi:hypothetical protein